ncbi:MAG: hypothetical protein JST75_22210 [Bacteroidetes bacterium]|nr:hypothetical protein [Bacteroidota bacterium]
MDDRFRKHFRFDLKKMGVVDITDRKKLNELLSALHPDTPAIWGEMNAQQMIEHLIRQVEFTNGKRVTALTIPEEEAKRRKELLIYTDFALPRGIKGEPPDPSDVTRCKNLPEAIARLNKELDDFEKYFKSENITAIHGGFGPLNFEEWIIWHGKHFTHHFKQFGLIGDL